MVGMYADTGPLPQAVELVATRGNVVKTLQGRRGAAQQYRATVQLAALYRHIPGGVAETVLLFIGAVVLLIDDNQAGGVQGSKNRRAGADDDVGAAVAGGLPGAVALGLAQAGVENNDPGVKALVEAIQGLRCQADFRYQHQRLPAPAQAVGDQLQVDLCFAGAGHAFEQVAAETLPGRQQSGQRGGLLRVELQSGPAGGRRRLLLQDEFFYQLLGAQLAQYRGSDSRSRNCAMLTAGDDWSRARASACRGDLASAPAGRPMPRVVSRQPGAPAGWCGLPSRSGRGKAAPNTSPGGW